MWRRSSLLLGLVLWCAGTASAGDVPAQGDEHQPRPFKLGTERFLDIWSYRLPPELRCRETPANRYQGTAGSLTAEDLYVEETLRLAHDTGEGLRLAYRLDDGETLDGRVFYQELELGLDVAESLVAGAVGEVQADKERADLGGFGELQLPAGRRLRLQATAVDLLFDAKAAPGDRLLRSPFFGRANFREPLGRWLLELEANADTLGRRRLWSEGLATSFERSRGHIELRRAADPGTLGLRLAVERARKSARYFNPGDARSRVIERDQLVPELWASQEMPDHGRLGGALRYQGLREVTRTLAPGLDADATRRREFLAALSYRRDLGAKWALRPELIAGLIDIRDRFAYLADRHRRKGGLRSKLSLHLERDFAAAGRFTVNPTLDLDEGKFGGGNVQLVFGF